jgi:hypothetical protein
MARVTPVSEPGDAGGMRAKDLRGHACLIQPVGSEKEETGRDGKPWSYFSCHVFRLDSDGIAEEGKDVRVSWGRVMKQLRDANGGWLAVKPVDADNNAVVLEALTGSELEVAERVLADLDE